MSYNDLNDASVSVHGTPVKLRKGKSYASLKMIYDPQPMIDQVGGLSMHGNEVVFHAITSEIIHLALARDDLINVDASSVGMGIRQYKVLASIPDAGGMTMIVVRRQT